MRRRRGFVTRHRFIQRQRLGRARSARGCGRRLRDLVIPALADGDGGSLFRARLGRDASAIGARAGGRLRRALDAGGSDARGGGCVSRRRRGGTFQFGRLRQIRSFGMRPGWIFVQRRFVVGPGGRRFLVRALSGRRAWPLTQLHALGTGAVARPLGTIAILHRRATDHLDDTEFTAHQSARLQRRERVFDPGRGRLRQSLAAAVANLASSGAA